MTEIVESNEEAPDDAAIRVANTTGQDRAYWTQSRLFIVHVSGEETQGRLSLVEGLLPPGAMTPLHPLGENQILYVLEGELTAYLSGVSRVLRRGECMNQPAGVPQTHSVTSSEPATRVLAVSSPAGFERVVAEAGRPAESLTLPPPEEQPSDLEQLAAIAAKHGMELVGPPGTLP